MPGAINNTTTEPEENSLLNAANRINVEFCMSFHNISTTVNSNELRFHLVLKFYYQKKDMMYFMDEKDIPNNDVVFLKAYGSHSRFFPFVIFNSMHATPINWSYLNKDKCGKVYERIELFATLSSVTFERYSPFILRLLNIKIGTDGTYKARCINLIPKRKNGQPQIDLDIFEKDTSLFALSKKDEHTEISINQIDSNVFCKTFVRDLRGDSKENLNEIYTRLYTCLFFESSWIDNLFKYVILSTMLMFLMVFTANLELGDLLGVNLSLILTEVALLFVLPEGDDFTTTERVLTSHTIIMIIITIFTALQILYNEVILLFVISVIAVGTALFIIDEYNKYNALVLKLKRQFYSNGQEIGEYNLIDKII